MPVNVSPEYAHAEKAHLEASTIEEKIETLQKLISCAPSHKGGENLRAQLRLRLKNLIEKLEKSKKSGKSTKVGIKKEDMQVIIIGKTKSGKSSLLQALTNAKPVISSIKFQTKKPEIGIMNYADCPIQMIENPSIESEYYDRGLTNSADVILILVNSSNEIEELMNLIPKAGGKKIIVFNKIDLHSEQEKRKISAYLQSKKYNFVMISSNPRENLNELKEKIFKSFSTTRVYTKEPGKEKSNRPIILKENSTVKNVAEKILKGFSNKVKQTKLWGPSSKFPGQIVSLKHILKDGDVVEFKTN